MEGMRLRVKDLHFDRQVIGLCSVAVLKRRIRLRPNILK